MIAIDKYISPLKFRPVTFNTLMARPGIERGATWRVSSGKMTHSSAVTIPSVGIILPQQHTFIYFSTGTKAWPIDTSGRCRTPT